MITDYQLAAISIATENLNIRKAAPRDAAPIAALVSMGEREGQLLPRSLQSVKATIGDWIVAEAGETIVGVGGLVEMGPQLVELRSLAVAPEYRSRGLGARIVGALLQEAKERGYETVFALTRAVAFFERQGFALTVKEQFPEKVWRDCAVCPVRLSCDEVAVVVSTSSLE